MSIWEVLGIAPTTDKAAIRHAYAQKTRTCHPEEDPEGFDALHKAFTAAMRAARQGVNMAVMEQTADEPAPAAPPRQGSGLDPFAAASAARAARRAAEQQAVEQYAGRAQRRGGKIIQLGQGEQEEGQQFDFAAVDAAPAQAASAPSDEPERPLTYEERAWRNGPAPAPETQPTEAQPRKMPEYRPLETVPGSRPGRRWRLASRILAAGVLVLLGAGFYRVAALLLIALCGCCMQGTKAERANPRFFRWFLVGWGVGVVAIPALWFLATTLVWGLHGAREATLDHLAGSFFLSVLAAPAGIVSALLARQHVRNR